MRFNAHAYRWKVDNHGEALGFPVNLSDETPDSWLEIIEFLIPAYPFR